MEARLERLKAIVEQLVAERDQLTEDRDRLIGEIKDVMRERDEARQVALKYREALRALDAMPESEALPWES